MLPLDVIRVVINAPAPHATAPVLRNAPPKAEVADKAEIAIGVAAAANATIAPILMLKTFVLTILPLFVYYWLCPPYRGPISFKYFAFSELTADFLALE